jgi:threonine/homoserine/homoserine lactone efflux protein
MSLLPLLLKGLIVGFSIAAPVGPIGMLCIQRSLNDGFKVGLLTGLGAATADGFYGLVAAFGLTALSSLLVTEQFWIRLIGGFFLLYLAIRTLRNASEERSAVKNKRVTAWRAYITTIFLTLTNPATILSFVAIFAGVGIGLSDTDYLSSTFFIAGVAVGSALWWLMLSGGIAYVLRHRMSTAALRNINIFSALILLSFAAVALWTCAEKLLTS